MQLISSKDINRIHNNEKIMKILKVCFPLLLFISVFDITQVYAQVANKEQCSQEDSREILVPFNKRIPEREQFRSSSLAKHASNQTHSTRSISQISLNSPKTTWTSNYASGLVPANVSAGTVTADSSGNVYIIGSSDGDYKTVKYDSSGVQLWIARYKGPGNSSDQAVAIAIDRFGNVYVTGFSAGSGTSLDYATVKYNSSGVQEWVARYNGPRNGDDYATAITLDRTGNVYVTGYSPGSDTSFDYATVMYSSTGVQKWVSRYNGPGNGDDIPTAMILDRKGDVYITGYSLGTGLIVCNDYATVRYNSIGVQKWVARYSGPSGYDDFSTAIALDDSNNVYVTGWSYNLVTARDYATVKYDSLGIQKWIAQYIGYNEDMPTGITLDSYGNVYVTGSSCGSGRMSDYATIKYNISGVEQWVARYNGPLGGIDQATAITLDVFGNVYVAGWSGGSDSTFNYATVKYNGSGIQEWVALYTGLENESNFPTNIIIDNSGDVVVTGRNYSQDKSRSLNYARIRYNSSGVQDWAALYHCPGSSEDQAMAIALDSSGNVYVTGYSYSGASYDDYATVKYNSSGIQEWVARFDGDGNGYDDATSIAVDGLGNVYVTGISWGLDTSFDYATVKYNASGVQEWAARYNGNGNSDDYAFAIALDRMGNVYVAGWSIGSGTGRDYATVKYNSSGIQQWVARYNGTGAGIDEARDIAVDSLGSVYVTGRSLVSSSGGSLDYCTVKYNSVGEQEWVAEYNGPGNQVDDANSITVDNLGNVYVTGRSVGLGTFFDYATVKYNSFGVQEWVARYNGPGNDWDEANSIVVNGSGSVYVTGESCGSNIFQDYATIKYNISGAQEWVARYDGPGNYIDMAFAIALGDSGSVYVTGSSCGLDSSYDYATVRYNSLGVQEWVARYNGLGNGDDYATSLVVDGTGNAYISGSSQFTVGYQYTTIKYESLPMYQYSQQWNLVSLPKRVLNPLRKEVFPSSITSLYEYRGSYVHRESLEIGMGYWLKFQSTDSIYIRGDNVFSDTVEVIEGWNLIGSITEPIKLSDITSIPGSITTSTIFGYDRSYFISDSIIPGKGYWIKCDQAGKLILSSSGIIASQNRIRIVPSSELPPDAPEYIDSKSEDIPKVFTLKQNYPNPFNPSTTIKYQLPLQSHVLLKIFDILGREVTVLVNGIEEPGYKLVLFDASKLSSGVYYYRLQAGDHVATKKLLLLK
jgi:uncharacterized delta-60 repeat protein